MDIKEIEQLVEIARNARISELTVSVGKETVKLRKPLTVVSIAPAAPSAPVEKLPATEPEKANEPAVTGLYVTAPMVGIFHSIDSITAKGATVKAGQVVGAIESMKLMNDIVSEHDGVIAEILIEDGTPVEYGQKLFRLDPA